MTGYGQALIVQGHVQIEISIKSVNGRFLETRFHLPKEYAPYEADLKKLLSTCMHRGNLDIYIQRKVRDPRKQYQIQINEGLLSQYQKEIDRVYRKLKLNTPVHLEFLLRQPDVMVLEPSYVAIKQEKKWLLMCFKKALKSCEQERIREGKELQRDFLNHLSSLQKKVQYLKQHRMDYSNELKEKFEIRIKEKLKDIPVDVSRIYQEVALLLDRSDIHEEVVRLEEHLKNYSHLILSKHSEGKKLEFYTQELLREMNTLSSKSPVADMTQIVVEAKSIIEKLKEQVLNVE